MKISSAIPTSFLMILALLVPCLSLTSCSDDDDIIWDFLPVEVNVHIQDTDGNNLLSPLVSGNLQGKKIVSNYEGQEYELNWDPTDRSRYYMPAFSGLTLDIKQVMIRTNRITIRYISRSANLTGPRIRTYPFH